ncbi:hypothetical protein TWF730_008517 [Orbilia blumenaviensis]|uniref:F-box domain-containing protein n=1 Tax=Orbilia blumenaviensis TaxID=1796055 RepID=A0AAV9V4Y3_9PEZI
MSNTIDKKTFLRPQGIGTLPTELHFEILSYLTDNVVSQISASQVCRLWERIVLSHPYFQKRRYTPLQTHFSELIAVHQIFGLSEAFISYPYKRRVLDEVVSEIRCKIQNERIVAYHCVNINVPEDPPSDIAYKTLAIWHKDKTCYAYDEQYGFGPPPDDEPGVLEITQSTILDEQCINADTSILPTDERILNEEVPRLTAPLGELDILTALHFHGERYPDAIFAGPINLCRKNGLTIRQLAEDIVDSLIEAMKAKSDLDPKKEHFVYFAMRYYSEGFCNECWLRVVICHPDVRISAKGAFMNALKD